LPHEGTQDGEWHWRDGHGHSVAQHARVGLVEFELVEAHSYRIRTGGSDGDRPILQFRASSEFP
jgi:hypothetical protein